MQQDLQLRADARVAYEKLRVWKDQPSFEEAERQRLPAYHDAVVIALADLAVAREEGARETQLRLFA